MKRDDILGQSPRISTEKTPDKDESLCLRSESYLSNEDPLLSCVQ